MFTYSLNYQAFNNFDKMNLIINIVNNIASLINKYFKRYLNEY